MADQSSTNEIIRTIDIRVNYQTRTYQLFKISEIDGIQTLVFEIKPYGNNTVDLNDDTIIYLDSSTFTTKGEDGFYDFERFEKVIIPDKPYSYRNANNELIEKNIKIVIRDDDRCAFAYCGQYYASQSNSEYSGRPGHLKEIFFGSCVYNAIGSWGGSPHPGAFEDCIELETINFSSNREKSDSLTIGTHAFFNTAISRINIPSYINELGSYAFYNCVNLQQINFLDDEGRDEGNEGYNPDDIQITEIRDYTFFGCTSLIDIQIPQNVTEIWGYAFDNCINIDNLYIPETINLYIDHRYGKDRFGNILNITYNREPETGESTPANNWGAKCLNAFVENRAAYSNSNKKELLGYSCGGQGIYTIDSGVETIKTHAFHNCLRLDKVIIPENVITIEDEAFFNCGIQNIDIGTGVRYIGYDVFSGCQELIEIIIPDNNTSTKTAIGNFTGDGTSLTSLVKIEIGNGVIQQSDKVFWDGLFHNLPVLKSIKLGDSISQDTNYTSTSLPSFLGCYQCRMLENFVIKDIHGVGLIGRAPTESTSAITLSYCTSLKTIEIPCNVRYGIDVFKGSSSIESIYITSAGNNMMTQFQNNNSSTSNYIADTPWYVSRQSIKKIVFEHGVKNIDKNMFIIPTYASNLYEAIRKGYYYGNSSEFDIILNDDLEEIPPEVFFYCRNLTGLTVPFIGCKPRDSSIIGKKNTFLGSLFKIAVLSPETHPLSWTIKTYDYEHNYWKDELVEVEPSYYIPCIGSKQESERYGNPDLNIDNINENLTSQYLNTPYNTYISMGQQDLGYNESNYNWNYITEDSKYWYYCYYPARLKNITILNSGITYIPEFAFKELTSLESIKIPESISYIYSDAFAGTYIDEIYIDDLEQWFKIFFESDTSNPIISRSSIYLNGTLLTQVEVPESITKINDFCFNNYSKLTDLIIHSDCYEIGESSFSGCSGLINLTLRGGGKTFYENAFMGCSSLEKVNIYNLATWAQTNTFEGTYEVNLAYSNPLANSNARLYDANGIEQINLDLYDISKISDWAFCGYKGAIRVSISGNSDYLSDEEQGCYIGNYAFAECSNLKELNIKNGIAEIGIQAFAGCSSLQTIDFRTNNGALSYVGIDAFSGCRGGQNGVRVYADSVKDWCKINFVINKEDGEWSSNPLYPSKNQNLYIGRGLGTPVIDSSGNLNLPLDVTTMNNASFIKNQLVKNLDFSSNILLENIGPYSFYGSPNLEELILPKEIKKVDSTAFSDCPKLTIKSVNSFIDGDYYFSINNNSNTIYRRDYIPEYGDEDNPELVTSITFTGKCYIFLGSKDTFEEELPEGLIGIDPEAFIGIEELNTIKLGNIENNITEENPPYFFIGANAFKDCVDLINVILPKADIFFGGGSSKDGGGVFTGCTKLKNLYIQDLNLWANQNFERNLSSNPLSVWCCTAEDISSLNFANSSRLFLYNNSGDKNDMNNYREVKTLNITGKKEAWEEEISDKTNWTYVYRTGNGCFYGCGSLEEVELGYNLSNIPDDEERKKYMNLIGENSFSRCFNLNKVVIRNSISYISQGAFKECGEVLKNVQISTYQGDLEIKNESFKDTYFAEHNYDSDGVFYIPVDYIEGNPSAYILMSVKKDVPVYSITETPEGEIIESLIGYVPSLSGSYSIKPNTISIQEMAFQDCKNLTGINLETSNKLRYIYPGAFLDCEKITGTVIIPDTVVMMGEQSYILKLELHTPAGVFQNCKNITTIVYPSNVINGKILCNTFSGCESLTTLKTYDDDGNIIGENEKIIFPNNISYVDHGAFSHCSKITDIDFLNDGDLNNRIEFNNYVFSECNSLTELNIYEKIQSFGRNCFTGCEKLTTINIYSDNIEKIDFGEACFAQCNNLKNINIMYNNENNNNQFLGSFGASCFLECNGLTEVNISGDGIGNFCFSKCSNLKIANLNNLSASEGCFSECNNLNNAKFSSLDYNIGNIFTSITQENIQQTLSQSNQQPNYDSFIILQNEKQEGYTVQGEEGEDIILTKNIYYYYKIPKSFKYLYLTAQKDIPDFAFRNCKDYFTVDIQGISNATVQREKEENIPSYEESTSYSNPVTYSNGGIIIGKMAYSNFNISSCTNANYYIRIIREGAFYGCSSLNSVSLTNDPGVISDLNNPSKNKGKTIIIEKSAFEKCENLKSVSLPRFLMYIGEKCFCECSSINSFTISSTGSKLEYIGHKAFYKTSLQSVSGNYKGLRVSKPEGKSYPSRYWDPEIGQWRYNILNKIELKSDYSNFVYGTHNNTNNHYEESSGSLSDTSIPTINPISNIVLCSQGIHFCTSLFDVFNYYYGRINGLGNYQEETSGDEDDLVENPSVEIYRCNNLESVSSQIKVDSKKVCGKLKLSSRMSREAVASALTTS